MDKWGKELTTSSKTNKAKRQIEQTEEDFIKPFDERGKTPTERVFEQNKE
ncbi:MAG: hypothetical protein H7Z37_00340 [Pyrinomonadaceae bacterium]|nr:hypothetical protein [Pyrinomonadaceae bacterium]